MKKLSINMTKLQRICTQSEKEFKKLGKWTATSPPTRRWKKGKWVDSDNESGYIFIDNGANILAVAHLDYNNTDTYAQSFTRKRMKDTDGIEKTYLFNGALDDRLGAFVVLELFQLIGIKADVLLTTNEEIGATTANDFVAPEGKEYNWIIQFDRRGTDVVMYQYDTQDLRDKLAEFNIKVGHGSFSCISALDHLGVAGFNWGTGYYFEHQPKHFAIFDETLEMLKLFRKFYLKYKDTKLVYTPKPKPAWQGGSYTVYGKGGYKYYNYCDDPDFWGDDEWKVVYGGIISKPKALPAKIEDDDICPSSNCPHFWSTDGKTCGACYAEVEPHIIEDKDEDWDKCPVCGKYITLQDDLTLFASYGYCNVCAAECFDSKSENVFKVGNVVEFIEDIYDDNDRFLVKKGDVGNIIKMKFIEEENMVEMRVEAVCEEEKGQKKERIEFRVYPGEMMRLI